MKYAVFASGGKQFKVQEGDVIEVDSLSLEPNKKHIFSDVLLVVDESNAKIGEPFVKGAKIEALSIEQTKGDKIRVAKFKAKARYRKVIGYRHTYSKIKIEKIVLE
jgi:large subunit ribosomal protein L21